MLSSDYMRAEELRKTGIEKVHAEAFAAAIALYDEAFTICTDDEQRELLTINKADAMIALGLDSAEVQQLPMILMRRRNLHHTFHAAYALMFKHRTQGDVKRAISYGRVALDAAIAADNVLWKICVYNDLGIASEMDSQFDRAIEYFQTALELVQEIEDVHDRNVRRVAILQNLGYNKVLNGALTDGVEQILGILDEIQNEDALAQSYIDLCYAYLELGDYEQARFYGEAGLHLAVDPRQIRNAHYLLGEVAYKANDVVAADFHFDELAKFYPEFRNLKSLLFSLDLRKMVNFRL